MAHGFATLIIAILLTGLGPALSHAAEAKVSSGDVVWYRAIFPPVTIPAGIDAGKGFFDQIMNFVIEELPEYRHLHHTANFKRIMMELQKGETTCCPSLYKTKEREQFIEFSIPALVVLPNGIITTGKNRSEFEKYLDPEGKVMLSKLLADQTLTLGISNGRLYSGGIDEILSQYQGSINIHVQSGEDVFYGLMSMMYSGRVDYIIGYPTEAGYHAKNGPQLSDFVYFPIQESQVSFTLGHIGCAKTENGKEIIDRVNSILEKNRHTDTFLGYYESWLDDSTKSLYRSTAREFFRSENGLLP